MYLISNKPEAIRQVQNFLGINESGKYDDKTKEEVIAFQITNNLEPSGTVDYKTFVLLRKKHNNNMLLKKVNNIIPFKNEFPYKRGDSGYAVEILNAMLASVIDKYELNILRPRGNYYNQRTEKAVYLLRELFLLPQSTEIDEKFYEKLERQNL